MVLIYRHCVFAFIVKTTFIAVLVFVFDLIREQIVTVSVGMGAIKYSVVKAT